MESFYCSGTFKKPIIISKHTFFFLFSFFLSFFFFPFLTFQVNPLLVFMVCINNSGPLNT